MTNNDYGNRESRTNRAGRGGLERAAGACLQELEPRTIGRQAETLEWTESTMPPDGDDGRVLLLSNGLRVGVAEASGPHLANE